MYSLEFKTDIQLEIRKKIYSNALSPWRSIEGVKLDFEVGTIKYDITLMNLLTMFEINETAQLFLYRISVAGLF